MSLIAVLRLPGGRSSNVVNAPVQLFDLLPTFMDLAGIDGWLCSTENVTGYVQFGLSLLSWIEGGTPAVAHQYGFAEAGYFWQNEIGEVGPRTG